MEMSGAQSQTTPGGAGGNGRYVMPPPGTRSSAQIRSDIVQQREELSRSVDALRNRWGQLTDLRSQIKEHKTELLIGAAVVGFAAGAAIALSRRR